jgi:polyisoprenoid-binding protein YceI
MKLPRALYLLLTLAFAIPTAFARPASESYQVDPRRSVATIEVGKSGAFSFIAGHTHEVTGPIARGTVDFDRADPSRSHVHLVIAAASLKVSGKNEPADDVPKVQEAMESEKVLWVARYPELIFDSTSIALTKSQPPTLDLTIDGSLAIRDVKRPISVPVHAELAGNTLTVTGRFSVKQTAYGIKPITVAGVVTVKDSLDIRFSIVALRRST